MKDTPIIDIAEAIRQRAEKLAEEQRKADAAAQAQAEIDETRERMYRYISQAKIPPQTKNRYDMTTDEMRAILTTGDNWQRIMLAFNLGQARGWNAGRRQEKKNQKKQGEP